jgi:hypothetical protein
MMRTPAAGRITAHLALNDWSPKVQSLSLAGWTLGSCIGRVRIVDRGQGRAAAGVGAQTITIIGLTSEVHRQLLGRSSRSARVTAAARGAVLVLTTTWSFRMNLWRRTVLAGALAACTAAPIALTTGSATAGPAPAKPYGFAVLGDIPYTPALLDAFPRIAAQVNADPSVQWVTHVGDIKSGSTVCSDEYFSTIKSDFDLFADPFVYSPGDNEWTDCHRLNNGGYNPLERLAKIREVFFPKPGRTLGLKPASVESQAEQGLPENVRWSKAGVQFSALHVVGSDNSLAPWTGETAPTPEQTSEVLTRTAGVIEQLHDTFADAREEKSRAVVLFLQADMFDPTFVPTFAQVNGFQPIIKEIARESLKFRRPVYLFNGDSHIFNNDQPLAAGSSWLPLYGISTPVPNLTRYTTTGSTGATDYLRVSVTADPVNVLSVTRVPYVS